jgi:hypothetical protein
MPGDESVQVIFQEAEWSGQETKATVEIEARRDGLGISVTHGGWTQLPRDIQLDARKRLAALWQHALLRLEHRFGVNGEDPIVRPGVPVFSTTVGC